ncbi:MAG: poly-gamma-glutamate biosynthesis protein PgsC [Flavobacteriia bacterium]|nr:poly-gamma-glutamate biosynthesis protein PgsC [Flavobacteriia bacterium]
MIELSITLGIVLSLLFIEAFGLAAGGVIIPGYIALQLTHFDHILGTIVISFFTFLILKLISKFTFLFGRRQMVVALLIGTLLSILSHHLFIINTAQDTNEFSAVGWVIPGLIAHWSAKQGYVKTIAMLSLTSVIVRLAVIVCFNGAMIDWN